MAKIDDYCTIERYSSEDLDAVVVEKIKAGWQPIGGHSVVKEADESLRFGQALVKYAEEPKRWGQSPSGPGIEMVNAAIAIERAALFEKELVDALAQRDAALNHVAALRRELAEAKRPAHLNYADPVGKWECGFRNIVSALMGPDAKFDIKDVVNQVRAIIEKAKRDASLADPDAVPPLTKHHDEILARIVKERAR